MTPGTGDALHKAICSALETETKRIVDEEAKAAAAKVEDRVRKMACQIAANLSRSITYEQFRDGLTITVKFPST